MASSSSCRDDDVSAPASRYQGMAVERSSRPLRHPPTRPPCLSADESFLLSFHHLVSRVVSVPDSMSVTDKQNDRGLIGPARQFGPGETYSYLLYLLPVGAILPIPFWLLGRRYPNSWMNYVNIPVMIGGASYMPPATGINYSSWFLVGFIFRSSNLPLDCVCI